MTKTKEKFHMSKSILDNKYIPIFFSALLIMFSCMQLEQSLSVNTTHSLFSLNIKYILLNLLTLQILYSFLIILTNCLWLSGLIYSIVTGVIALVNYYTIMYHGLPLSTMELGNIKTALNVVQSYKIMPDGKSILIFVELIFLCVLCFWERRTENVSKRFTAKNNIRNGILCVIAALVLWFGYFCASPIKPSKTVGWSWQEAYYNYGYTACTIEVAVKSVNAIQKPDNYDEDAAERILAEYKSDKVSDFQEDVLPDIIVILNESFYDLSLISDFETDVDYLEEIHSMDNLISGYAIVPSAGGGTNSSEYELLTSNSLQLMPGITPFNVLDMNNATSIVSHLKNMNYTTVAAHCSLGSNYSRSRAYPAMGFDSVYFVDDFENIERYHDRWFVQDSSLYGDLIRWYEESIQEENPVFMYLLTIQNHGGWDLNAPEYDTVHVKGEVAGGDVNEVNEYLTGIKQSSSAFKELTEYFENSSRPVVILMVGDHCPSFAPELCDSTENGEKLRLLVRSTPFYIWSNQKLDSEDMGTIGMTALMPKLLETAGVPLSSYYQYISDLSEEVPVMTCYDLYFDKEGKYHYYIEDTQYKNILDTYFSCEYKNLKQQ